MHHLRYISWRGNSSSGEKVKQRQKGGLPPRRAGSLGSKLSFSASWMRMICSLVGTSDSRSERPAARCERITFSRCERIAFSRTGCTPIAVPVTTPVAVLCRGEHITRTSEHTTRCEHTLILTSHEWWLPLKPVHVFERTLHKCTHRALSTMYA